MYRSLPCGLHFHEAANVSAPTYDLGTLHGGLRLTSRKSESTHLGIQDVPVPSQLVLPITQAASLLGKQVLPLAELSAPAVAVIDESLCIGCTHCRNACPVDAIVGAHQLMHTIIASECTGCELCIAPCPVDCISMRPLM